MWLIFTTMVDTCKFISAAAAFSGDDGPAAALGDYAESVQTIATDVQASLTPPAAIKVWATLSTTTPAGAVAAWAQVCMNALCQARPSYSPTTELLTPLYAG